MLELVLCVVGSQQLILAIFAVTMIQPLTHQLKRLLLCAKADAVGPGVAAVNMAVLGDRF